MKVYEGHDKYHCVTQQKQFLAMAMTSFQYEKMVVHKRKKLSH